MNFLLINQYAGNKGDRAVLYAMCILLKKLYNGCNICVSTSDPKLWTNDQYFASENITFIPEAWDYLQTNSKSPYWKFLEKFKKYTFTLHRESFLRNIKLDKFLSNPIFYKAVKTADKVICVGGHHFTTLLSRDLVSSINFNAMSALSRKSVICFSQTFGPFEFHNPRNKKLTQQILSKCILMPRENNSINDIKSLIGKTNRIYPTFESVLSLADHLIPPPISQRDNALGIAIYCTQHRSESDKLHYQDTIAKFCDYAISKGFEQVRFFPMEMKGTPPDDRHFINEIVNKTLNPQKCYIFDEDLTTENHLKEVSKCKLFLGHKTHSTIFALTTGTPLIAIAYHPKTVEFLHQFNLERNVINDTDLTIQNLTNIFDRIIPDINNLSLYEFSKAKEMALKIKNDLFSAIENNTLS